jgi:hypothetical protein
MVELTRSGKLSIKALSEKYAIGEDAINTLLAALIAGRGSAAQFNHADLGGMGQWVQGGMIMIGDMFNNDLKHRVGSLCNELAKLLNEGQLVEAESQTKAHATTSGASEASYKSSFPKMEFASASKGWRPSQLGVPASTGSQNDLHYAYFAATHRLALLDHGKLTIFDTGEHQIHGFSQSQSAGQTLSFESQSGLVKISELKVVQI